MCTTRQLPKCPKIMWYWSQNSLPCMVGKLWGTWCSLSTHKVDLLNMVCWGSIHDNHVLRAGKTQHTNLFMADKIFVLDVWTVHYHLIVNTIAVISFTKWTWKWPKCIWIILNTGAINKLWLKVAKFVGMAEQGCASECMHEIFIYMLIHVVQHKSIHCLLPPLLQHQSV